MSHVYEPKLNDKPIQIQYKPEVFRRLPNCKKDLRFGALEVYA